MHLGTVVYIIVVEKLRKICTKKNILGVNFPRRLT